MSTSITTADDRLFNLSSTDTTRDMTGLLDQVQRSGGIWARWRVARTVNTESVALLRESFERHMEAKRQVMAYRIDLAADEAMKRALKDNVATVAVIEREIARIASETLVAFKSDVIDVTEAAYRSEMERKIDIDRLLENKQIAPHRHDMMVVALTKATDQVVTETEAIIDRIVANLARRFDAAVSPRR